MVGGVEEVIAHQARLFSAAGHRVRVIAGRGSTWDEQIPVVVFPLLDSRHPQVLELKAGLDQGFVPAAFADLQEAIFRGLCERLAGVNLVIAHNLGGLNKNLAATAALRRFSQASGASRLVLWQHDLAWTAPRYQAELHPGWPWDLLRTPWPEVLQVTISSARQAELAGLMGMPLDQIRVIPNGIDLQAALRVSTSGWELARELRLLRASPLLLTPVRVTRRKNLELGLRVLAELRSRLPDAALVITGPPGAHNPANAAYLAELSALRGGLGLEGAAHLLGELRPEGLLEAEVTDLYQLADALFLPSREEGFGLPILEAGLARLPIFCADIPPLRQLAGDWAEYFSPDGDPRAIAAAIHVRLEDTPAFHLRQRVKQDYSWEAVYHRYLSPLLEEK